MNYIVQDTNGCFNCNYCSEYYFCTIDNNKEVNPIGICDKHSKACTDKKYLKDDIDMPIKNCVKYLNLLGVKTRWSCCGFDYKGQHTYKCHDYRTSFICMDPSKEALHWIPILLDFEEIIKYQTWRVADFNKLHVGDEIILRCSTGSNVAPSNWQGRDSCHSHELPNTNIKMLENSLLRFKQHFKDECIIEDFNKTIKETVYPYWQYEGRGSWEVRKEAV